MYDTVRTFLGSWNSNSTERQKLQHVYVLLTVVVVLLAGLISLFNANTGHNIVKIGVFTVAAFASNAIIWNLLKGSLLEKLPTKTKRK